MPTSAGEARDVVRGVLAAYYGDRGGRGGGTQADDALLVVSELVSNAVRHGGGLTVLSARVVHGELVLEVGDHSPVAPRAGDGEATVPGGFGWVLAGRLCRSLDVHPLTGGKGKVIVACLPL
ncbi:ATP-binding protein [Streptomyces sp. SAS_260]